MHHAFRRIDELARKHHIRLPLRIGQQGQQFLIHLRARPAKREGVGHHIGNQPTRVRGLERLRVVHEQTHAGTRFLLDFDAANAVRHPQSAPFATQHFGAAARQKRTRADRPPRRAQPRHGMRCARRGRGLKIVFVHGVQKNARSSVQPCLHSSSNSGTSQRSLNQTPPPSSRKFASRPRRYNAAR